MRNGSLVVVGTGIQLGQMTLEASSHIEGADKVLYLVTDPVTADWIENRNKNCEKLNDHYSADKERLTSYLEMIDRILGYVREGLNVCAVFYGHPGVFVFPSHEAVRRARAEGYRASMLPGVSAEDCLFADLNIDPATYGCQSFEATDFLVNHRTYDPTSHLIIWQIGVIGDVGYKQKYDLSGLGLLSKQLSEKYSSDHSVTIYEAARYVVCEPKMSVIPLSDLAKSDPSPISTLYVPPASVAVPDLGMVHTLGIPASYLKRKQELTFSLR